MATTTEKKIEGGFGGSFAPVDPISGQRRKGINEATSQWNEMNGMSGIHLTRAEKASQAFGTRCYIYNISPILSWERRLDKFGIFLIPKAPSVGSIIIDKESGEQRYATKKDIDGDYKLSAPIIIANSYIRPSDAGEGKMIPHIEYGEDIAEDIVGCSKRYPADLVKDKDLTKKGVFIVYGKTFEECTPEEQRELLLKAEQGHRQVLREKVNNGDRFHEQSKLKGKGYPMELHRQCALYLARVEGDPKIADRPWVTNRGLLRAELPDTKECQYCGSDIKKTAAICPVCKKTVDAKLLAELEKGSK
jgi:hypothetical protein